MHRGSNSGVTATVHKKICDDLQRLINELDFAGGFGSNLQKINQTKNRTLLTMLDDQNQHRIEALSLIYLSTLASISESQCFAFLSV